MGKFLSDFKEFAMKGNVIDMAVGVIIGGAFGKIVSSLVNAINYGTFIMNIVDFFIIALSIFVALRVIMKFKKKEEEAPAAAPEPTAEEKLLTEIRDILKSEQK